MMPTGTAGRRTTLRATLVISALLASIGWRRRASLGIAAGHIWRRRRRTTLGVTVGRVGGSAARAGPAFRSTTTTPWRASQQIPNTQLSGPALEQRAQFLWRIGNLRRVDDAVVVDVERTDDRGQRWPPAGRPAALSGAAVVAGAARALCKGGAGCRAQGHGDEAGLLMDMVFSFHGCDCGDGFRLLLPVNFAPHC